ncbi:hypothetical protein A3G53_03730 [Candidatus Nomurabacteria bacterium RIFCSPLOWO2_12_FULL_44_11]|uniref:Uncharacterized protein n=1 Tax=Candidatus Nomurabacteria bacterium RIFCSPLOWO2_12_FULL_44_11 TaxID=1801796 RepID=A0A1F6Y4B3_9BACT|nr:MAG: hypothetical protein A3G53_03730 [Candidatus Nomurabacteria bacterium RIFCSPLOWO2_12_FULL_44_11]
MDDREQKFKPEEHYICLGGCRGVSKKPGVCQTPDCVDHGHEMVRCSCTDGRHNNFEPLELKL